MWTAFRPFGAAHPLAIALKSSLRISLFDKPVPKTALMAITTDRRRSDKR